MTKTKYLLLLVDPDDARQEKAFDRKALAYLLDNSPQFAIETDAGPDIAHLALLGQAFLADINKEDFRCVFYDVDKDNATFTAY